MIIYYIKSFIRNSKRNRFFYFINLIGFLIGFLLLTIIFTYVYQELNFDNFHKNRSTIYRIHSGGYGVTPLCFGEKLKNQAPEINGIVRFSAAYLNFFFNDKEVEVGKAYYTDPELFQLFSFKLITGDAATVLKAPFSIVINQSTAGKLFGKNSPIGETLKDKEGTIYTVTGVMDDIPYNSHIQSNAFISIETLRHTGDNETFNCGSWSNLTYIRLTENTNPKATEAKINLLLDNSKMGTSDGKIPLKLEQLKKIYFDYDNNKFDGSMHGNRQTVIIYLAISILLLLIVISNYINLSTAISGSRSKEIAIHKVNGAKQIQIVKQQITESIGVALISFIAALLLIELLLPRLSRLLNIPISASLNRSSLYLYYFIGTLFIGLITGLIPGIFLSKTNEIKALKNETLFNSRGIQRKIVLVFQLIIVAVLLNSTFIVNKQIGYVIKKDLGFNYENVISINLNKTLQDKNEVLRNNLLKNPGVESVTFSDGIIGDGFTKHPLTIGEITKLCNFYSIDPDYLNLYRIKLKYGTGFSNDVIGGYLINEAACKEFGIDNPVGKFINKEEIIGVVNDFNFATLHNKIEPLVLTQGKGKVIQIKLSPIDQKETIRFINATCRSISPEFEGNCRFLDDHIRELYKPELNLKNSFEVYSSITFLIALLGLFGLTLFLAKKKTREISIRKLHGATFIDTFKLFAKDQLRIVVMANVIAVPLSILTMKRWLVNFQYKVDIGSGVFLKTLLITIVFMVLVMGFIVIKTHNANSVETLKQE